MHWKAFKVGLDRLSQHQVESEVLGENPSYLGSTKWMET
jgi:hypothetical protein